MQYHWNKELLEKAVKLSGLAGMCLNLVFFIAYYVYGDSVWLALIGSFSVAIIRFSQTYQHYIEQNTGSFIELSSDHFKLAKPVINYEIELPWSEIESVKFVGGGLNRFSLNLSGNRYQSFYHFKQPKELLSALNKNATGGSQNNS